MAIEYSLNLGIDAEPKALAQTLARECGMETDDRGPMPRLLADGILCWVDHQSALGRELNQETFGINSGIRITCQVNKFELYEAGMDRLLDLCARSLAIFECDLVLLENGEKGWVLRKHGQVLLDEPDESWRKKWADVFATFNISFLTAQLPTL